MNQTIYAPSTGLGRAAISVIRVSGPSSFAVIEGLTGRPVPEPRRMVVRRVFDADGAMIDDAMVVVFPGPGSFSGEDMAEIHCHGGRAVVTDVCARIDAFGVARLAEAGEFTRRAFLNGRISLSEAEGLADLIAADTAAQRRQAARLLSGALGNLATRWRADLINALAMLEVTIDWVDEEVPEDVTPDVKRLIAGVRADFSDELSRSEAAERLRAGFQVALVGAPNAGKSTLLNALAGRDAAIVSDRPGTTRDVVEVVYDLNGLPVTFLDMAGLRDADDSVERIGVDRARERASHADIRIFVAAWDAPLPKEVVELRRDGDLFVWAKADLGVGAGDILVSCVQNTGIDALLEQIFQRLQDTEMSAGLISHLRHREALQEADAALARAVSGLQPGAFELVAVDVHEALHALDVLIGRVGVEDVLDTVFSQFCLGK